MLAPIDAGGKGQLVTLTTGAVVKRGSGVLESYSAHSIDGSLIKSGDRKFLLSALEFTSTGALLSPVTALAEPTIDETVLTFGGGAKWRVKQCDPLSPAGLAILYTLQLRPA